MPGSWEELQDINDLRKTAVIDAELRTLNVDIADLQETRFADSTRKGLHILLERESQGRETGTWSWICSEVIPAANDRTSCWWNRMYAISPFKHQ